MNKIENLFSAIDTLLEDNSNLTVEVLKEGFVGDVSSLITEHVGKKGYGVIVSEDEDVYHVSFILNPIFGRN